ncbi:MAG: hypothetical protein QMC78_03290 [Methanocellales archaeon]|nr:hypothetical protein [Methanocellales archaeon]
MEVSQTIGGTIIIAMYIVLDVVLAIYLADRTKALIRDKKGGLTQLAKLDWMLVALGLCFTIDSLYWTFATCKYLGIITTSLEFYVFPQIWLPKFFFAIGIILLAVLLRRPEKLAVYGALLSKK